MEHKQNKKREELTNELHTFLAVDVLQGFDVYCNGSLNSEIENTIEDWTNKEFEELINFLSNRKIKHEQGGLNNRELANLFERFFSKWVKDNKLNIIKKINITNKDFLEYSKKVIKDINKLDKWVV